MVNQRSEVGTDRGVEDLVAIDQAIASLESQRSVLGDAVVETAIQPLLDRKDALLARLGGGRRKLVTVLFSDVVDFTALAQRLDPEDVRLVVNGYFARWHQQIEACGGVVEKFIGDAVMAVFGFHQAREDDPHQAIRAALAMRRSLDELNLELEPAHGIGLAMRVGIDTGEVVVTTVDDRHGQGEVVVGETVNLAARLQAAAPPGGVLISGNTHRHVRGGFGFRPTGPLDLKGFTEPVEGYLVISERPRGFELDEGRGVEGVDTRTVGRDLEMQRLREHFEDVVEERRWRMVTVVGDAGVGKSRLLREFDRWLAEMPDPVWWFRGRASPTSQNLPNALLRGLMTTRLDIQESDGPDEVRVAWERAMEAVFADADDARHRAHLIGHWLGFELGPDADLGALHHDPQGLRERARTALAEYVRHLAADSPVVVLLEDLHWADEASLAVIEGAHSALESSCVLVIATTRPELFERYPTWGEGLASVSRLPLESLSRRQSRVLLAEILQKADRIPESLIDLVIGATDGNPFYIEELVKWLIETGVIATSGEPWQVREDRIDQAKVPPTLRGVLQARLDALPPAQRRTLQRASVIGRVFWDDAVEKLGAEETVPVQGKSAEESLDRLRGHELVYERRQSSFEGTREFLFKHALFRDVTYDSVLKSERVVYHRLAAEWLRGVAEASRRADQYAGIIAEHHDVAGMPLVAARWYLRAGRQALAVHALAEAGRQLSRGIDLTPDSDLALRFDLLLARETLLDRIGDRAGQQADLVAMDRLRSHLDPARGVQLLNSRANWAFHHSDYADQIAIAHEAVDIAHHTGLIEAETEARLIWGKGLAWAGRHSEATEVLEKALEGARALDKPRLIGETLRYLGIVAGNLSDFPRAMALLEEALQVQRAAGDREGESLVLAQTATALYNQGRYREARVHLEGALPLYRESGHVYRQSTVLSNIAGIALINGDLGVARRLVDEAVSLCRLLADREGLATSLAIRGEVHHRAGMLDTAVTDLEAALTISEEIEFDYLASDVLLNLGLIALEHGVGDKAQQLVGQAVSRGIDAESPLATARARLGLGRVLLMRRDLEGAEGELTAARQQAGVLGIGYLSHEAGAGLAEVMLERGDLDGARAMVDGLMDHLDPIELEGSLDPGQVYLTCWRVLDQSGDPRAAEVLTAADSYLTMVTGSIDDEDRELRDGFLATPINAQLTEALDSVRNTAGQ